MKTIMGIILIAASLFLGYMGMEKWDDSTASIEIGKLELSAGREQGKKTAYLYFGGAALALIAGVFVIRMKK